MNTSPSGVSIDPQEESALEELKEGVAQRLLPVCREWSTGEFDALVIEVATKTLRLEMQKREGSTDAG